MAGSEGSFPLFPAAFCRPPGRSYANFVKVQHWVILIGQKHQKRISEVLELDMSIFMLYEPNLRENSFRKRKFLNMFMFR